MQMIRLDADAAQAAVAVGAQRIAAYADRNKIPIDPQQCEELAETLAHLYQAFYTGLTYRSSPADAKPTG